MPLTILRLEVYAPIKAVGSPRECKTPGVLHSAVCNTIHESGFREQTQ